MQVALYHISESSTLLPLFLSRIQAGFPSPADDYIEKVLSLDEVCIDNPDTTFLGRVTGKSLKDIDVNENDVLVIDKSTKPRNGDLIVAVINGEFNAKFLKIDGKKVSLVSANTRFKPLVIDEFTDFQIWGVVIHIIKDVRGRWSDIW